MSSSKGIKCKCKNIMYVQQMNYLQVKNAADMLDIIENRLKPKKTAVIVHDKDIDANGKPVEPHIHAMLSFQNARSLNSVAKQLSDKPQQLQAWKGDSNNGYAYLIHATKDAQSQHQYSPKEVVANFDYEKLICQITTEIKGKQIKSNMGVLLDALYNGAITKKELEETLTGSQYGKARRQIEDVWAKYLQRNAEEWRKQMKSQNKYVRVIWISGCAGVGKTSLAKDYAKKIGQEYFISGSSRDIFQNYAGEHIMILDEFRPHIIAYHDLLKITDPFGIENEVMAPSRYYDKALACEIFIITSPYDPLGYYTESFKGQDPKQIVDSFEQLNRRITLYIMMDEDYIYGMKFDRVNMKYEVIKGTKRHNNFSSKKRPAPSVNAVELYNSMVD